jgi:phospholipid transport system transporter-binding protein
MAAVPIELKETSPGNFAVHGLLTFPTARLAREIGLAAMRTANRRQMQVDCSGITASDSAGMTVLLDWLSFAKRSSWSLHYVRLPPQLEAIAEISDVLELLEKGV